MGNAFHQSEAWPSGDKPETICKNCHNVLLDVNNDGAFDRGLDLVLQTTEEEHSEYRAGGGTATCVDCHMPLTSRTHLADAALLWFEQDSLGPKRQVRSHAFAAIDYPLDQAPGEDIHRPRRKQLLQQAATFSKIDGFRFVGRELSVRFSIRNVGAGHYLPTGFAFARQMWIELIGENDRGEQVFSSGVLSSPEDDLCDATTLDEPGNPAAGFLRGCTKSDPQLVNIQQKLVDKVQQKRSAAGELVRDKSGATLAEPSEGGQETWLQLVGGGVVSRKRPLDGQPMTPLAPGEERTFEYRLPGAATKFRARLLFRNLPPYMIRALAKGQSPSEAKLAPMVKNLQIVEMASLSGLLR